MKNLTLFLFLIPSFCLAQMQVSSVPMTIPGAPITYHAMVQSIFNGIGQISNIQITGDTINGQAGWFKATATNLGLFDGMLLTSGDINSAVGPNINTGYTGFAQAGAGDADLTAVMSVNTFNAFVIELDIVPSDSNISLEYIFASDEYLEFAQIGGTNGFNDCFAFFITGNNPAGGVYNKRNFALVPNTNIPVTINNINCVFNSQYYICNDQNSVGGFGSVTCNNMSGCPTDNTLTSVEYDGFTVPLTATVAVIPNQSYHLKLVIADGSDNIIDSGIFLKKAATNCSNNVITPDFTATIDGCAVDLTNNSTNASQYYWTLGDGTTANTANVSHTYANGGTKNICLNAVNATCDTTICKQITPPQSYVNFTANVSGSQVNFTNNSDIGPLYSWDFGDNTSSTNYSPTHTYCTSGTKNICLYSSNPCDNPVCISISILPPIPNFTYTVNGYTANFNNNSVPTQHYSWTFGDGTTDTATSPTHTYATIGQKLVCLYAFDSCLIANLCQNINITAPQSISEANATNLNIYPNPTDNILHISAENVTEKKANLILFNNLGQIIWEKEVFTFDGKISEHIDLQSFPKGLYSFLLQTEHTFQVQKVMKE